MNKFIGIGTFGKDPELRTTPNGVSVATFSLAFRRKFKDANGEYGTDWLNCVAWRGTGEFVAKHFSRGDKIGIVGAIQTRTYDDANGNKRYVTEVVVDEAEFVTSKGQRGMEPAGADDARTADELFGDDCQPVDDADLPF